MAQFYFPIINQYESIFFEELLNKYRRCGYSLRRTTPQPHEYGSYEQQIVQILWHTGCITLPLNDPIHFALSLLFYLSEENQLYILTPLLPLGNKNVLLGEDLAKIYNALKIYYGNLVVYNKITSLCTFDPNTGILKYGR